MLRIVAVEGLDGAGKSTLLPVLAAELRRGTTEWQVIEAGEFGSRLGDLLRQSLTQLSAYEKVLWFAADRLSEVERIRAEMLTQSAREVIVLWDRYVASAMAYRAADAARSGIDRTELLAYVQRVNSIFPAPVAVIFLEVPIAVSVQRQHDVTDETFLTSVKDGYEDYFASVSVPILRIDATAPASEVAAHTGALLRDLGILWV